MRHRIILEPAALLSVFVTAISQLAPVIIYFLLRLAPDLERDGLVGLEHRAAVEWVNGCPSSSNGMIMTDPTGLP